jgi:hypothetical protein
MTSKRSVQVVLALAVGLALLGTHTAAAPAAQLSEDQIIDQVMALSDLSGAADLTAELQSLAQALVNDPDDYGGIGYSFTKSQQVLLYYRGSAVSTLAMVLPLLPGSVSDTNTLRGRMAARLKTEVVNYLLVSAYWDWEYATTTGAPYVYPANPRIQLGWQEHWRVGPHWEKMYALWAYAYYTGDWATIQANWSFIKARYQEGDRTPGVEQRAEMISGSTSAFRNASNDLASGLIGYVRMADHFKDSTAAQARQEARSALAEVLRRLDVSWASCPVTVGWDNTAATVRGEWTPGYNLTPEVGRWVNDRARSTAQARLDEAANANELRGHWWAGSLNNGWIGSHQFMPEDASAMPSLSHELFLGRAWMLLESGASLRQVKPWHVVMGSTPEYRDMLYLRSLYALISRNAQVAWVAVGN